MAVLVAVVFGILSFIAIGAGKKGLGIIFGLIGIVVFITWLRSGAGFEFLDWLDNPSGPEIPDNIPIPGQ